MEGGAFHTIATDKNKETCDDLGYREEEEGNQQRVNNPPGGEFSTLFSRYE